VTSLDNLAAARAREFAWSDGRVYLNAASFGPLPERSRSAIELFHRRRWQCDLSDADLVAPLIAARAAAARLIGATAAEIALTPNTNLGINIAATAALGLGGSRRVIVIHDREFPANVYAWLALERQGFRVEIVPPDASGLPREDELLTRIEAGDVAAVSVSFVQFASGHRADITAIGKACRRNGTLYVIDAIQGLGAVPLDVSACYADILACGGQKWLCSPWGSGFTFIRRELITQFEPLLPGWLSFEATQDFTQLLQYRYDLLSDARRFETGSLGFQDYLGLQLGIELLLELDVDRIWQHIRALQQPLIEWAQQRGVPIVSALAEERRSGILCLRPGNAEHIHQALEHALVRCALRESSIRISPHWYNTVEDIERVVNVLDQSMVE
jgi:selenocysteine lyase/cysteine desulfurase